MRSKGQPIRPRPPTPATSAPQPVERRPEHWSVDAGEADVAQLTIPPDAVRDRTFEVFCSLQVRHGGAAADAWHGMRVLVNGAQEWSRRVPTDEGGRDSIDYRFRRVVPNGEALRVVVTTEVKHAWRTALTISADED